MISLAEPEAPGRQHSKCSARPWRSQDQFGRTKQDPLGRTLTRRREAAGTVNAFTDRVTRLLLGSGMLFSTRGRFIAPALSVAGAVLRVPAIRRRVMRRVTMLDQSLPP